MDGDLLSQSTIDSLKSNGYVVHLLDSSFAENSVIYKTYYYHESARIINLRERHVGRQLGEFTLIGFNGENLNTNSLNGKPTMINTWSVVCRPCIVEMPFLNQLKTKYKDQVQFVAIALEDKETVSRILNKHTFEFDQYVSGEKQLNNLGVRLFPTSFFIDESGTIVEVIEGTPVPTNDTNAEENTELTDAYSEIIEKLLN